MDLSLNGRYVFSYRLFALIRWVTVVIILVTRTPNTSLDRMLKMCYEVCLYVINLGVKHV